MIRNKLLKNAWRKTGYDWFEGVVEDKKAWTAMATRTMTTRHTMTAMMMMTMRHMTMVMTMRNGKTGKRMGHKKVNMNIFAATRTTM
jgi:hypothetical protein